MRTLLLLITFAVILNAASLQRNNSRNVVIDQENRLMWMDNMDNVKIMLSHQDSTAFCDELKFAGYTNWRIPHIEEYELIVDKRNETNYINRAFRYNQKAGYWAETAHFRTLWFYADYMHFISGTPYFDSRFKLKFVRCVRDIE